MSQTINLWGATYSNVPAVDLPKQGGGTARFTDVTDTTAAAADVASGKYFYTANGTRTAGTGSGGGTPTIKTATVTNASNTATSLAFTNLTGNPVAFFVRCASQIVSSGNTSYYYVDNFRYNGTNHNGTYVRIGSTRGIYPDTTHYNHSYAGTTLTITTSGSRTAAGGSFYNGTYELVYIY